MEAAGRWLELVAKLCPEKEPIIEITDMYLLSEEGQVNLNMSNKDLNLSSVELIEDDAIGLMVIWMCEDVLFKVNPILEDPSWSKSMIDYRFKDAFDHDY